jgi:hypothetical protein
MTDLPFRAVPVINDQLRLRIYAAGSSSWRCRCADGTPSEPRKAKETAALARFRKHRGPAS